MFNKYFIRKFICVFSQAFRDSPLGFTILGSEDNIQNMRREDIIDYIERNYTGNRMVVAATGDVNHKAFVEQVQNYFSSVPTAKPQTIKLPEEKPFFCGSELIHRNDDMGPIAHVAVAFEGVPWKSPGTTNPTGFRV